MIYSTYEYSVGSTWCAHSLNFSRSCFFEIGFFKVMFLFLRYKISARDLQGWIVLIMELAIYYLRAHCTGYACQLATEICPSNYERSYHLFVV